MQKIRNVYKIVVRKPAVKRPLGRPRCRWEEKKLILGKWGLRVWIGFPLAQDGDQWGILVNMVINLRVA
jgi:hypothetical protein